MDIVTHAVLGATLATALASTRRAPKPLAQRRIAAGAGAAAGLLPDADALIQSGADALLVLDYHRHFTHALAFVPIGALVAALLLWPLLRRRLGFGALYLYSLAGYLAHPLLDACTSYGTHLWLPFSPRKEAWNLIAVFDPLFTLLLALPLAVQLLRPRGAAAVRWSLLGAAYLGIGFAQQQRVEAAALETAQARGHRPAQLSVKPSMANLLLWRALYVHDGRVQVDAFHAGATLRHYPGASAPLLDAAAERALASGEERRLRDIRRFRAFSDGFAVVDPAHPGFVGDARYAMQPTAIAPIWGIEWPGPGAQTRFVSRHDFTPAMRHDFLAMLAGRDLIRRVSGPAP